MKDLIEKQLDSLIKKREDLYGLLDTIDYNNTSAYQKEQTINNNIDKIDCRIDSLLSRLDIK